ncbi:MAG: cytidine deaminase [Actinobacteria bacterium]|nr:cytidine deaminase [Actinomycetota bacterium]
MTEQIVTPRLYDQVHENDTIRSMRTIRGSGAAEASQATMANGSEPEVDGSAVDADDPAQPSSQLVPVAKSAAGRAYAPYSRLHIGAALLTETGNIYSGCNVENRSYGLTCCAERNAVFSAVACEGPQLRIQALAVWTDDLDSSPPCGACRQVLMEFGPDLTVIYKSGVSIREVLLSALLPESF